MLYYAGRGPKQSPMKIFGSLDAFSILVRRLVWAGACLLLAACTIAAPTANPGSLQTTTPLGKMPAPGTPASAAATPEASATPSGGAATLRIWLPPDFAPDGNLPGSDVLASQLAQFELAHPQVRIETRVKASSGVGGLLHSLAAASNVAPAILPNVIALNRDDLAAAAAAGLVIPLGKFFPADTQADYYPFANALSRNDAGERMGLPFAADAPVLVYNTHVYGTGPLEWTEVTTGTFIFPGAETSALTVLDEYLALGGPLTGDSGKVALNAEILAAALAFFRAAGSDGLLPMSTLAYADSTATWQAFRDGHATLAVTSARYYLTEWDRAPQAAATLLPALKGNPLALVQGWSWALVSTEPERQKEAADLVAWLTAAPQLSAWTQTAGVLPTRPSILAAWPASPRAAFADAVLSKAQLRPPEKILGLVAAPLRQALTDVLYGRATAQSAAGTVVEAVNQP